MNLHSKGSVVWVCLALLYLFSGCKPSVSHSPTHPTTDATSIAIREHQVLDLNGHPVDPFYSEDSKEFLLFIFTMVDCPISNRYAPTIQRLHQIYQKKVRFCLVYPDPTTSPSAIKRHLQDYGYTIEAVRDPRHELVKWCNARVTPEVVLVGLDGHIVYQGRIDNWYEDFGRNRPEPTIHDLESAIEAAIKGEIVDPSSTQAVGCYIGDLKADEN